MGTVGTTVTIVQTVASQKENPNGNKNNNCPKQWPPSLALNILAGNCQIANKADNQNR